MNSNIRFTLYYIFLGIIWLFLTDFIIGYSLKDLSVVNSFWFHFVKGVFFFILSGIVLYFAINKYQHHKKNHLPQGEQDDALEFSVLNQKLIQILKSGQDGYILLNRSFLVEDFNQAGNKLFTALFQHDLHQEKQLAQIVKNHEDSVYRDLIQNLKKGNTIELYDELSLDSGQPLNLYLRFNPILLHDQVIYTYVLIRDISSERESKRKLLEFNFTFENLLTNSRDGYISISPTGYVKNINESAKKFLKINSSNLNIFKIPTFEESNFETFCRGIKIDDEAQKNMYLAHAFLWVNVKVVPSYEQINLFLEDVTNFKVSTQLLSIEKTAVNLITQNQINDYEILSQTIRSIEYLIPNVKISYFALDQIKNELVFAACSVQNGNKNGFNDSEINLHNFENLANKELIFNRKEQIEPNLFDYNCFEQAEIIKSVPLFRKDKECIGVLFLIINERVDQIINLKQISDLIKNTFENIFDFKNTFHQLELLSVVAKSSNKGFATIRNDNLIIWKNQSFRNIFKNYSDSLIYEDILVLFTNLIQNEQDLIQIKANISNFQPFLIETTFAVSERETIEISLGGRPLFTGNDIQFLLEFDDITERKKAENTIRKNSLFLKDITDSVPFVLFQLEVDQNMNLKFPFISSGILKLNQHIPIEKLQENPLLLNDYMLSSEIIGLRYKMFRCYLAGADFSHVFRIKNETGVFCWVKVMAIVKRDELGNRYYYGSIVNINEEQLAKIEIEKSNNRFTYVSKAVNEAIWDWDLKTNDLHWSDGFTRLFGYSLDHYPKIENWQAFIHAEDFQKSKDYYMRVIQSPRENNWTNEYRLLHVDGTYRYVIDRAYLIRDKQGRVERIIGSIQDVTQKRDFEKQKSILIHHTQDDERRRFSMELHDGLAQYLVALNLYMNQLDDGGKVDYDILSLCKEIVQDGLNLTRALCYSLSPPELNNGLIPGVRALFERLDALNEIQFEIIIDPKNEIEFTRNLDAYNLFRIIQEFTNNSIKYAKCNQIQCEFGTRKNIRYVKIKDNGIGFDIQKVKKGFGLENMEKRGVLINAKLNFYSTPGKGTELIIYF